MKSICRFCIATEYKIYNYVYTVRALRLNMNFKQIDFHEFANKYKFR